MPAPPHPPTRALIAEDEPLRAASLAALLDEAWPELEIAGIAANGPQALDLAARLRPEVAFLDIRMPGLSGLEVAAEIADRLAAGEPVPRIVFVTAYDEYALQAFEVAAVDYLLKPVSPDRLALTVAKLRAQLAAPGEEVAALAARLAQVLGAGAAPAGPAAGHAPLTIIRAAVGETVRMIPVGEICYFQASDKYTTVVTAQGEALIRTPLRELLAQLPQTGFRQVHRSTIVNLEAVAAAVRDETGRLSLKLRSRPETLAVSRVYAELFRAM